MFLIPRWGTYFFWLERSPVAAEVASWCLVVPAILSKRVAPISLKPRRVQKGAILHPFCTPFRQLEPFSRARLSPVRPLLRECAGVRFRSEDQRKDRRLRSVFCWRDCLRVNIQRGP